MVDFFVLLTLSFLCFNRYEDEPGRVDLVTEWYQIDAVQESWSLKVNPKHYVMGPGTRQMVVADPSGMMNMAHNGRTWCAEWHQIDAVQESWNLNVNSKHYVTGPGTRQMVVADPSDLMNLARNGRAGDRTRDQADGGVGPLRPDEFGT
ncbi:hypothetical protein GJAV_G00078520 [Gymnothorax javanicus]|nr:hypothetical protein GJAV_G00078520 [Gymnothorax javanicus]